MLFLPLALKGESGQRNPSTRTTLHPATKIYPVQSPVAGRMRLTEAGLRAGRAKARTHKQTPTDLHKFHQGHWVEEMEPGKSVLSGGGIGYACDLQRGSVAGKDCVSVERKTVEY